MKFQRPSQGKLRESFPMVYMKVRQGDGRDAGDNDGQGHDDQQRQDGDHARRTRMVS